MHEKESLTRTHLEKLVGYQVSYASKRKPTNKPFYAWFRIKWYSIKLI